MKRTGLIIALMLAVFTMQAQTPGTQEIPVSIVQDTHEIIISWETKKEVNSSHFLVGKTTDGIHYETVAMIKAAGHSIFTKSYMFTDADYSKNCSYRVTLVNMEGIVAASGTVNTDRAETIDNSLLAKDK